MLLVLFSTCCLFATMDVQGIPRDVKNKPRTLMNTKELILYRGYHCEEHEVVTQDGFILSIFRIPYGREGNISTSSKPAVLLQHGMLGEAYNWIASSPYSSLGFILADNGCDVWLGCSRGSPGSKKHVSLSTEDENFWAFSFDHMAQYDLPATIDFILQKTGQQQLFYVGHSQGSTIGFIAFSTMPDLARKIKINFALAPVVSVKHAIPPLKKLFTLPDFLYKICDDIVYNLFGSEETALNMSQVDGYEVHHSVGTSVQNLLHWSQVLKSGKLQAYDYGIMKNLERYEKMHPPEYNVSNMNVSTAVWNFGNDALADPEDVALLLPQITNLTYHKFIPEWGHDSFICSLDAYIQLHSEILRMIKGSYRE